MIELTDIHKEFPAQDGSGPVSALSGLDIHVKRGEIFGIIGRSGAGKSTLLRMVNGLETPTSGEVRVDGQAIHRLREQELRQARLGIGMIFQHFNLLWSRTVRDNIAFPLEVAGKPKDQIRERVEELLERVGLKERADAYPSQLSGGQKQRVGIARALANEPKVLLCDEATSALDPETTSSILQLLREINRDTGITLLLITHEMSVVQSICQRVAVMDEGKVIETGDVKEIFDHPRHSVTAQFVKQTLLGDPERSASGRESGVWFRLPLDQWASVLPDLRKEALEQGVRLHVVAGELTGEGLVTVSLKGEPSAVENVAERFRKQSVEEVAAGVS
ncbi:methionine ABC transporter ATP-binding protein [Desmospora profundinema]|uniref:D-methionine transport system ATP-binding protein n=1 Tax=Desmospora profundinema TaxID=1571184 RepID=A0ABU1ILA4_9BACL|nr:ATP-binding cassette domain-containing protein [Desmospora profundinema]MDR6225557.1 D-methionine transport system ATP-binding protein [Desmospora profundinema]